MAKPPPLSKIAADRNREAVQTQLGDGDRGRLAALLPLIGENRQIRLSEALTALFPEQSRDGALTALRQFRARIKQAATEAGVTFELRADTQTRTLPEHRVCWFVGDDRADAAATRFTEGQTRDVVRVGQTAVQVDPKLNEIADTGALGGKRTVRYFISYAHADIRLKDRLHKLLRGWFGSASRYKFVAWQDTDILVGELWHEQIQVAIQACDFGLLLVSSHFLASDYITRQELQHFISGDPPGPHPDKGAVPVALSALRFDGTMDMKGLERHQIFRDPTGRAFEERSSEKTRKDFVNQLFGKIVQRLDFQFGAEPPPAGPRKRPIPERMRDELGRDLAEVNLVPSFGHVGTMNKQDEEAEPGERKDAVQFLLDWACEANGPPCCALLGSVGIGKTTTSKAFAHTLLQNRESDSSLPMPIYLDLRDLGEAVKAEPDLQSILHTVLRRSWQGGETDMPLDAAEVIRLVRQEGAIVIFDGLDEVLVHLSQAGGQQFTRELLRILPPNLWPGRRRAEEPGRPGRVMLTCRTHYFRSLREQQTHLTLEDRDDVRDTDYRVFILLPFDDDQIRAYLGRTFPGREVGPILDTIHAVHNLPEMATRPMTLSLIARSLPQIERWQLEGRRVTGVDIYRHMVQSWLERDSGKHEFDIDHKQQIMEHVAAALWNTGGRTWTARQMDDWLADFMERTPSVAVHYRQRDLNLLKKDLRTATFLVGGGRRPFRFAHTSLQEFFLAGYLLRALREDRRQDWDLPRPSRESFDFLGQMMLGEADVAALDVLAAMCGSYRARVSEWVFAYILQANEADYPAPSAVGIVLDGADLRDWTIAGAADRPLLALSGARFRRARLDDAVFRHVDLDGADFAGVTAGALEVSDGRAVGACFERASLPGAVFRDLDLSRSGWAGAGLHRTEFLGCLLHGVRALSADVPAVFFARCEPAEVNCNIDRKIARLALLGGHTAGVVACAFSPDGARILSASDDNTLRLWDAASGKTLRTLEGHSGSVTACAFSADGARILSASGDNTLRIWDAASGKTLRTLKGHSGSVTACAFSPDGARILSASGENILRIWDAASGKTLRTLEGHTDWVMACAFSPDGARILSASHDTTLRTWDADSGKTLRTLEGHSWTVTACAFSPDGARILSASGDKTLRIWDAASGKTLRTLEGHTDWVMACAFSPDGARILSASHDNTLRIWDAASSKTLRTLEGHSGPVTACAFSPDGARILSASHDNTLRIWDAASSKTLRTLEGHTIPVTACAFSPDGARILSASGENILRIWDAASGKTLRTLEGHTDWVMACAFSPDGARILSASHDTTLRTWDAASGKTLRTLEGHSSTVTACAFSPDGARILSASGDKTLRVWDAASGKTLRTLEGHSGPVTACAFSPDGARILSASGDKTLRVWDAASGKTLRTLEGHTDWVMACAFSPDGARILSASLGDTLRLWDAASGKTLRTLEGHSGPVTACAFSPDGARILSASHDKTLRVWDAASGKTLRTLEGHTDWVMACAFSPDGARILSASHDNTLRIWDAASSVPVGFRVTMLGAGNYVSLSADGAEVLEASEEAWRDLGWLVPDENGALETYPAEVFGPLPGTTG